MDEKHLHQPLLPLDNRPAAPNTATATATTTSNVAVPVSDVRNNIFLSNFGIALRLLLIVVIGVISTWAYHEASKGFVITITNNMKNTPVGEKFSLFYVSNDEATRLVQGASGFATKILYPDTMPGKLIDQVDIHLVNQNLTLYHDHIVVSEQVDQKNKIVLFISSRIMEYDDFRYRIGKGIQRCMAEILVFNGHKTAPKTLLNGMVEYISNSAGFGGPESEIKLRNFSGKCWDDKDPKVVARFLGYCERIKNGFIGRLSRAMRDDWEWDEGMVDRALGTPAKQFCESFHSVLNNEGLIALETISGYR